MSSYTGVNSDQKYTGFLGSTKGLGVSEGAVTEFFAKILPSFANSGNQRTPGTETGLTDRWRVGRTLADMVSNVTELIKESLKQHYMNTDEWLLRIVPTIETTNTLTMSWHRTEFAPSIPGVTPPHAPVRLLDVRVTEGQTGMTRLGIGLEVDGETINSSVENGVQWFVQQLSNIPLSVMEGDKLAILSAILTAHRNKPVYFFGPELYRYHGLQALLMRQAQVFASVVKERVPIETWRNMMATDMQLMGVNPDETVFIVHDHTKRRLTTDKKQYTDFNLGGERAVDTLHLGERGLTVIDGSPVYTAHAFTSHKGVIDLMRQETAVGAFYPMLNPAHGNPGMKVHGNSRRIRITNPEERGMSDIDLIDALRNTGRWDAATGRLNTFKSPGNWAHAPAGMQNQAVAASGGGDMFHDPGTGNVIQYFGSANGYNAGHFLDAVESYLAGLPEQKRATYLAAMSVIEAAIRDSESEDVTTPKAAAFFKSVSIDARGTKPDSPDRCNSNVLEATRTPDGFIGLTAGAFADGQPGAAARNAFSVPPGIGSYAGLKAFSSGGLDAALNPDGMARKESVTAALRTADEMAQTFGTAFSHSLLLNKSSAGTEVWYPTETSQFVDALVPSRATIWITGVARPVAAADNGVEKLATMLAAHITPAAAPAGGAPPAGAAAPAMAAANAYRAIADQKAKAILSGFFGAVQKHKKANAFTSQLANPAADIGYDEAIAKYETGIRTLETNGVPSGELNAIRRDVEQVKAAIQESEPAADAAQYYDLAAFVRTPLYAGPEQIKKLAAAIGTAGAPPILVSSPDFNEVPMTPVQIKSFAAALEQAKAGGGHVVHGQAVSLRPVIGSEQELKAVALAKQLHAAGLLPGTQQRQIAARQGSGASLALRRLGVGSAAAVPAPSGITAQDIGAVIGCITDDVLGMATRAFLRTWNEVSLSGKDPLAIALAHAYMTVPLNLNTAIPRLHAAGVPVLLEAVLYRTIHVSAYPVIRMKPGMDTMAKLHGFRTNNYGTDQHTNIFGIYHHYYMGIAMFNPQNICIYHGVDPAGYLHGGGAQWRDTARHAVNPTENQGEGKDLIAVLIPYGLRPIPAVHNPGRPIAPVISDLSGSVPPIPALSPLIMAFETWRLGWSRVTTMVAQRPATVMGSVMSPAAIAPAFFRDTVYGYYADGGRYVAHEGAELLPTGLANNQLRRVLDGSDVLRINNEGAVLTELNAFPRALEVAHHTAAAAAEAIYSDPLEYGPYVAAAVPASVIVAARNSDDDDDDDGSPAGSGSTERVQPALLQEADAAGIVLDFAADSSHSGNSTPANELTPRACVTVHQAVSAQAAGRYGLAALVPGAMAPRFCVVDFAHPGTRPEAPLQRAVGARASVPSLSGSDTARDTPALQQLAALFVVAKHVDVQMRGTPEPQCLVCPRRVGRGRMVLYLRHLCTHGGAQHVKVDVHAMCGACAAEHTQCDSALRAPVRVVGHVFALARLTLAVRRAATARDMPVARLDSVQPRGLQCPVCGAAISCEQGSAYECLVYRRNGGGEISVIVACSSTCARTLRSSNAALSSLSDLYGAVANDADVAYSTRVVRKMGLLPGSDTSGVLGAAGPVIIHQCENPACGVCAIHRGMVESDAQKKTRSVRRLAARQEMGAREVSLDNTSRTQISDVSNYQWLLCLLEKVEQGSLYEDVLLSDAGCACIGCGRDTESVCATCSAVHLCCAACADDTREDHKLVCHGLSDTWSAPFLC